MRALGIDPGYDRCGFAVIDRGENQFFSLIDCGIIQTNRKDDFLSRQQEIGQDFISLLQKYEPDRVAIEDLFFVNNITTGLKVAQIRGVLTYLAQSQGCEIFEPKPTEVKKSFCGHGKADKKEIQKMAQQLFRLNSAPKFDDAADAIAVAFFGLHSRTPL